jgi:hypothetical protein
MTANLFVHRAHIRLTKKAEPRENYDPMNTKPHSPNRKRQPRWLRRLVRCPVNNHKNMKWRVQTETADGLTAHEIMEMGSSDPARMLKRPVQKRLRAFVSTETPIAESITTRLYELTDVSFETSSCIYREVV